MKLYSPNFKFLLVLACESACVCGGILINVNITLSESNLTKVSKEKKALSTDRRWHKKKSYFRHQVEEVF